MSHRAKPGQAIVDFMKLEMGEESDLENKKWVAFPRILLKIITGNTYLFTRLLEMC